MTETHKEYSEHAKAALETLRKETLAEKPAPTAADLERQEQTRKSWEFAARMATAIVEAERKILAEKPPPTAKAEDIED